MQNLQGVRCGKAGNESAGREGLDGVKHFPDKGRRDEGTDPVVNGGDGALGNFGECGFYRMIAGEASGDKHLGSEEVVLQAVILPIWDVPCGEHGDDSGLRGGL